MGKPMHLKNACRIYVGIYVWEPCEVKHLSSTWKRKKVSQETSIPSVVASERGTTLVYKVHKVESS